MIRNFYDLKFEIGRIGFVRLVFNMLRKRKLEKRFYNTGIDRTDFFKGVVFCVDGHIHHGGFADRMFGILQTHALCKHFKIPFKIYYKFPFDLEQYLVPSDYDWKIKESDLSYNIIYSKPLLLLGDYNWVIHFHKAIKSLTGEGVKQVHIYANVRLLDKINQVYKTNFAYDELFHELFKPSAKLSDILIQTKKNLPPKYISLCFRHRNVFGDFEEARFQEISEYNQKLLIKQCKDKIADLIAEYNVPAVVTSDSLKFIKAIQKEKYVYTVLKVDKTIHMDFDSSGDFFTYCQSFIDFYSLAEGNAVFMFLSQFQPATSGFPMLIAWCNGKELKIEKI